MPNQKNRQKTEQQIINKALQITNKHMKRYFDCIIKEMPFMAKQLEEIKIFKKRDNPGSF